MNKLEAAAYLNISVRTLERMTTDSKISVRYIKGKTRPVADYEQSELDRMKLELSDAAQQVRPAIASAETQALISPNAAMSLANLTEFGELLKSAISAGIRAAASDERLTEYAAMFSASVGVEIAAALKSERSAVSIESKLILSVAEASALSGVSRNELLEAIHTGKLKARKRRGWRIKRADLDAYVKML